MSGRPGQLNANVKVPAAAREVAAALFTRARTKRELEEDLGLAKLDVVVSVRWLREHGQANCRGQVGPRQAPIWLTQPLADVLTYIDEIEARKREDKVVPRVPMSSMALVEAWGWFPKQQPVELEPELEVEE